MGHYMGLIQEFCRAPVGTEVITKAGPSHDSYQPAQAFTTKTVRTTCPWCLVGNRDYSGKQKDYYWDPFLYIIVYSGTE